jgi:hypothetical protein
MMNVVSLPVPNARDVDIVLDGAKKAVLSDVIVLGFDADGEFWSDLNFVDAGTVLVLLELAKARIVARLAGETR